MEVTGKSREEGHFLEGGEAVGGQRRLQDVEEEVEGEDEEQ